MKMKWMSLWPTCLKWASHGFGCTSCKSRLKELCLVARTRRRVSCGGSGRVRVRCDRRKSVPAFSSVQSEHRITQVRSAAVSVLYCGKGSCFEKLPLLVSDQTATSSGITRWDRARSAFHPGSGLNYFENICHSFYPQSQSSQRS